MPGAGTGPGRDPSSGPISPQKREVERMANIIAADVARLEAKTIDAVLPALLEAREELRRELAIWLAKANGAATFTAQDLRRGLASIETALEAIGKMRADLQTQLLGASTTAATLAADHLREQLARFGAKFGESIRPTQISTAAIIARAKHEIIPRIRTSSHRYVQAVREDMRRQMAIGLARGETFTQMTNRLRRLGGPRGLVALRGVAGEPGAYVEEIAEGLFNRYRHWAERVVRTEVINAYNVEHVAGIRELNDEADDEDDELLLKWDASPDRRICATCRGLDGRVTKVGKPFRPGIEQPPAHPNCRCVAVAWHPSWGGIDGEFKPTSAARGAKLPKPSTPKKPRAPRGQDAQVATAIAADMTDGRKLLDRQLSKRGFAAQPSTKGGKATVTAARLPLGVLGQHHSLTGNITLAPPVATIAREFAAELAKDPKGIRTKLRALQVARRKTKTATPAGHADALELERKAIGMHVLVHESFHGFGPLLPSQYRRENAKVEEIATELAARAFMRQRYGITAQPARGLGAYEHEVQQAVTAVRSVLKLSPGRALRVLEAASEEYKRVPQPTSIVGAPTPIEHLGRAIAKLRGVDEARVIKALQRELKK